ncbi:MAG: SOS response-associated peptidase [Parvularculaceae bacterium]
MVGRYILADDRDALAAAFAVPPPDPFPPRYNIAPTQPIAVVRRGVDGARECALVRWGFIPSWAKGDALGRFLGKPLINARAETAADKPTFRSAFRRRRCLVPASGYYEWRTEAGGRQPYLVAPADGRTPVAFAGIWETALDPDGGEVDAAAILTIAAGPSMRAFREREPVVIPRDGYGLWLDGDETSPVDQFLAPAPDGCWRARKAPAAVNDVRNERPALLADESSESDAGRDM